MVDLRTGLLRVVLADMVSTVIIDQIRGTMMHHMGARVAVVTSNKIWHFLLVTTRPIAHPGGCACIIMCNFIVIFKRS